MDRSRVELQVKPMLGTRKVAAPHPSDVSNLRADIAAAKTTKVSRSKSGRMLVGGADAASRTVSTMHSIFAHDAREGVIKSNLASGVRRIASNERRRRLSAAEIDRFGEVTRDFQRVGELARGLDLVRLIALTCFRLDEAQAMRRDWLDRHQRAILFPHTKSDHRSTTITPNQLSPDYSGRDHPSLATPDFRPSPSGATTCNSLLYRFNIHRDLVA